MKTGKPDVIVLAGPNGAGKSTTAPALLKGLLEIDQFVNADAIAQGLSAFAPEAVALQASAIMLKRMHALAEARESFAFETTLAGRSYAVWLRELVESGYRLHLIFLWLASARLAIERVAQRVRLGGHSVPEETIRRRYKAGLRNLFQIYQPLTTTWRIYDNSAVGAPGLVAVGRAKRTTRVADRKIWRLVKKAGQ